jgi:hypothetical protein
MKFPHTFANIAVSALVALSFSATPLATAQTVISNESLVSTTFVVNKAPATAKCKNAGCSAKTPMFAPVLVTCPAVTGQTCTFHISLDEKVSLGGICCQYGNAGTVSLQFLIDDAAPTIGPTRANGLYLVTKNVVTFGGDDVRQGFSASVLGVVTNSGSNDHAVALSIACADSSVTHGHGCSVASRSSTMRVDVFEP